MYYKWENAKDELTVRVLGLYLFLVSSWLREPFLSLPGTISHRLINLRRRLVVQSVLSVETSRINVRYTTEIIITSLAPAGADIVSRICNRTLPISLSLSLSLALPLSLALKRQAANSLWLIDSFVSETETILLPFVPFS